MPRLLAIIYWVLTTEARSGLPAMRTDITLERSRSCLLSMRSTTRPQCAAQSRQENRIPGNRTDFRVREEQADVLVACNRGRAYPSTATDEDALFSD